MKKQLVIAFVLVLCLMSVAIMSVLAMGNDGSDGGSEYAVVADPGAAGASPSATGSFSGALAGEYANYAMVLQGDYRYWKMTITNSGDYAIVVNVDGTVYTVAKGDTVEVWSANKWRAGAYTVGFSCATAGKTMRGSVVCDLHTSLEDVR